MISIFPFICSNIPAAPAYGVFISQMIRYSRACGSYQNFLDRGLLLTRKLLNQGFLWVKLKTSLRKFYGCMTWLTVMEYLCHLHHVVDEHEWPVPYADPYGDSSVIGGCQHGPLEENRDTTYFDAKWWQYIKWPFGRGELAIHSWHKYLQLR
jgi:hypothetical protein